MTTEIRNYERDNKLQVPAFNMDFTLPVSNTDEVIIERIAKQEVFLTEKPQKEVMKGKINRRFYGWKGPIILIDPIRLYGKADLVCA